MKTKSALPLGALAALALVLAGCSAATPTASEPAKPGLTAVNLTLPAAASLESVVYDCVPNQEGFFKKEGLQVTVNIAEGSVLALQSLETGTSDVVVVGTSPLMAAVGIGSTAKAFANVVSGSYAYPAVLPGSPIKTFLDLQGKTVGVPSLQSGSIPFTKGLVALAGGNPSTVRFQPVSAGAPSIQALKTGQVDALGFWDTVYAQIESLGQPLRFIQNAQSKKLGFQVVYAAKSAWLDKNPKVAAAMTKAMNEAYVFASTNPYAALQDCWKEYPNLIPTGVDKATAVKDGLASIKARLSASGPVDGLYGNTTSDQVSTFYSLQVSAGTVKPGITAGQLWTNKFIKPGNQFDVAAIKKLANSKPSS